jgi:RNA polymerase sigma-70 factor (ECF subfamily)
MRELYREHALLLRAYAERFTGDRDEAEDAVQETFLRAWRNLPRLLGDDRSARPWLLQVLRRVLIDAARAAAVRPSSVAEDCLPEPAADDDVQRLLDRWLLADAVNRLSPAHRRVLVDVVCRGTPAQLLAAELGVPAGTIRSRLHYALRELRRHLGGLDIPVGANA